MILPVRSQNKHIELQVFFMSIMQTLTELQKLLRSEGRQRPRRSLMFKVSSLASIVHGKLGLTYLHPGE
jgi:hypothetical protein